MREFASEKLNKQGCAHKDDAQSFPPLVPGHRRPEERWRTSRGGSGCVWDGIWRTLAFEPVEVAPGKRWWWANLARATNTLGAPAPRTGIDSQEPVAERGVAPKNSYLRWSLVQAPYGVEHFGLQAI